MRHFRQVDAPERRCAVIEPLHGEAMQIDETEEQKVGLEKGLPRILINHLKQIPDGMNINNIYYNYWTNEQLIRILIQTELVININFGIDVLSIICDYCLSKHWDKSNTSNCMNIKTSNDNKVTFVVSKPLPIDESEDDGTKHFVWYRYYHSLLTDWIGNEQNSNKLLYRYIFN